MRGGIFFGTFPFFEAFFVLFMAILGFSAVPLGPEELALFFSAIVRGVSWNYEFLVRVCGGVSGITITPPN